MTPESLITANRTLEESGLTPQQFVILHLADTVVPSMSEIAKATGHTTAASTGIVERMVNDGLIERVPEDDDRRVIRIKLSESNGEPLMKTLTKELKSL